MSYFFPLRTYGKRQHELWLDKQSSQQGKNSLKLTKSCLECLGFAEEVRKLKTKNNLATVPFFHRLCQQVLWNAAFGSVDMKETKSWSKQWEQKGVLEATELLPAWRKWQNETCDVSWSYLRSASSRLLLIHSLSSLSSQWQEERELNHSLSCLFVNKADWIFFKVCARVCVWAEHSTEKWWLTAVILCAYANAS